MIIPVRCFTCNKVIGHLHEQYIEFTEKYKSLSPEEQTKKFNEEFKGMRLCCKRMLLGQVNIIDELLKY